MPNRFAELLAAYLKRAGDLSVAAFAERVGLSQPTMHRVATGGRPPDLDALDRWADVLGLEGDERATFILAGQLAHCPQPIVDLLEQHRADQDAMERRIGQLTAIADRQDEHVRRLIEELAALRQQPAGPRRDAPPAPPRA